MIHIQENIRKNILESFLKHEQADALFVDEHAYSYADLSQKVFEIYAVLAQNNVQSNRIGIYCTDDFFTYAAILACLFYGSSFVPLNSKYPSSRLQGMVDAAELTVVLTSKDPESMGIVCEQFLQFSTGRVEETVELTKDHFNVRVNQVEAYLLFTSGTTGVPKGVPISTESVTEFFAFFHEKYPFSKEDRFIQVFELSFDVSIFSFLMPMQLGACCYILPQKGIRYLEL